MTANEQRPPSGGERLLRRRASMPQSMGVAPGAGKKPLSPLHGAGVAISGASKPGSKESSAIAQVSRAKSEGRLVNRRNTIQIGAPAAAEPQRSASYSSIEHPPPARRMSHSGPTRASAGTLASKYRFCQHEVNEIITAFESVKENCTGGAPLTKGELEKGLGVVFGVGKVKNETVEKVFEQTTCATAFSVDKFLEWYMVNMFSQVAALRGDEERIASDNMVYELAKKFNISAVMMDKMKQRFDMYDEDKSGCIELPEFKQMLATILRAKKPEDLSDDRVKKFFNEIDLDGSGEVDFQEYAKWYLKYFNSNENPNDAMAGGTNRILEQFYGSFDPTNTRAAAAAKMEEDGVAA